MTRKAGLLAAGALLAGLVSAQAAEPSACPPAHPALARGINVPGVDGRGNWLKASPAVLDELAARGLTHVRLPVKAEALMPAFADPAAIEATVADVAAALDAHLARVEAVVVDLHGGAPLGDLTARDPAASADEVSAAWDRLAPVLTARPAGRVYAEMLNEPRAEANDWHAMAARILPRMRAAMPEVPIVISTGGAQRFDALAAETPPADPNVVYAVHYYDPMVFTHQGAAFLDGPIARLGSVPYPLEGADPRIARLEAQRRDAGDAEAADYLAAGRSYRFGEGDIRQAMDAVGAWSKRHGVPVVIGEFGVLQDRAPPSDRIAWMAAVARAAEAACLGWTHWELDQGFGILDRSGRLDPAAVDALFPSSE